MRWLTSVCFFDFGDVCRYASAHPEDDVVGQLRATLLARADALIATNASVDIDDEDSVTARMASFFANVKGEQKQPGLTWEPELFALPTPSRLLEEGSAALNNLKPEISSGPEHASEFVPSDQDLVVPGRIVLMRRSHVGDDEKEKLQQSLDDRKSLPPRAPGGEAKGYICGGLAPTLRRFELSRSMAEDHLMDRYMDIIAELYAKYQ